MLFKLAWRNLWRNKRRTLITAASVFFAVILAVLMQSMQKGTYAVMIRNVVGYYTGYIQIHQKGFQKDQSIDNCFELTSDEQAIIEETKGVRTSVRRIEHFALAHSKYATKAAFVVGTDPVNENKLTHLAQRLMEGRYFRPGETEVMLTEGLAKQLHLVIGDTLTLIGQGFQASSAAGLYRVCGIINFGNPELNRRLLFMPLDACAKLFSTENRITTLALDVEKPKQMKAIKSKLIQQLDTSALEVLDWYNFLPELKQSIDADQIGGKIMLGILYLLISFGIFGTLLMMLAERQHEFGVLIAIGMKKLKLAQIVLIELINIITLGVMAGMIASIPVMLYFYYHPIKLSGKLAKAYENLGFEPVLQTSLEPIIFVQNAVAVLIFALIIALYPFYKITKIKAIDAMKS